MKVGEGNLRNIIYAQLAIAFLAFWAGFLQYTKFEFIIYIFYFVLLAVGTRLIFSALRSKVAVGLKVFLLTVGFSSTVYFIFFIFAAVNHFTNGAVVTDVMESLEDILYLVSFVFLISTVSSIFLLRKQNRISKHENQ
mgnify:CR=1 FL=1|jgi:hypothetical protein